MQLSVQLLYVWARETSAVAWINTHKRDIMEIEKMRFLSENVLFFTILSFILGGVLMCAYAIEENKALPRSANMPQSAQSVHAAVSLDTSSLDQADNHAAQAMPN